jgi:hypothetical protein
MNFEIELRFFPKFESKGNWILWVFVFTNVNSPMYKLGQLLLQGDLKTLLYDMDDMHKPTPKIKDVMEFRQGLSIKESTEIFQVWRI